MADESFKEFVLDQLSALPEVRARAMFGAHGLYQGERFFGILDEGRLFFKRTRNHRRITWRAAWNRSLTNRKGQRSHDELSRSATRCFGKRARTGRLGATCHPSVCPQQEIFESFPAKSRSPRVWQAVIQRGTGLQLVPPSPVQVNLRGYGRDGVAPTLFFGFAGWEDQRSKFIAGSGTLSSMRWLKIF